ncbi:hypothetical protein C8R45DRAFT_1100808 [Mycena sanguinolenta]|nr:hypothetical protein C8R45DRAFT_1100808 [Mycena sanguinolenta]
MVEQGLESAIEALNLSNEPFFHPWPSFEDTRRSEGHKFYVVLRGRVPGIYSHWRVSMSLIWCGGLIMSETSREEASKQVVGFANAVYKKHTGWSAAFSAWSAHTQLPSHSPPPAAPTRVPNVVPRVKTVKIEAKPVTSTPTSKRGAASTSRRPVSSAPSTQLAREGPYLFILGARIPLFTRISVSHSFMSLAYLSLSRFREQASVTACRGLADGSFGKVEVTSRVSTAFDLAAESTLAVFDISDTESN